MSLLIRLLLLGVLVGLSPAARGADAPLPGSPSATAEPAAPRYRVTLATMAPGPLYWERFGHNAIVVEDPDGRKVAFNFGYFDFEQPGFLRRFLFGEMRYLAVALDADTDLSHYVMAGRQVWLQDLDLTDAEARRLVGYLSRAVSPAEREYRYHYFRANCSTRIRDAIDHALDGALERGFRHRSHGETWRRLALAHAKPDLWMALGMHLGLGLPADEKLSRWQEFYIPARLKDGIDDFRRADGRPLVLATRTLGGEGTYVHPYPPNWWPGFLAWGLAVSGLMLWAWNRAALPQRRRLSALGAILAFAFAAAGCFLIFLWAATLHVDAGWNQNLFLLNPLWFAVAVLLWREGGPRGLHLAAWGALLIAAAGSFMKVFPAFGQQNIEWVLALLPVMAALLKMTGPLPDRAGLRDS